MATVASPTRAPETRPANNFTGVTLNKLFAVKAVGATAPDSVALTAAQTDVCVGVLAENIPDQARGDMNVKGRIPVTAGAAIAAGVPVAAGAGGKVFTAVAGNWVIGTSVDAAAADGDVIAIEADFPGSFY